MAIDLKKLEERFEFIFNDPNTESEFQQWVEDRESKSIDAKITRLLDLTDEFIFPAYYAHTDKLMWKIKNVYTDYSNETFVLCGVDEGISKALDLAIEAIDEVLKKYYGYGIQ